MSNPYPTDSVIKQLQNGNAYARKPATVKEKSIIYIVFI